MANHFRMLRKNLPGYSGESSEASEEYTIRILSRVHSVRCVLPGFLILDEGFRLEFSHDSEQSPARTMNRIFSGFRLEFPQDLDQNQLIILEQSPLGILSRVLLGYRTESSQDSD